MIQENLPSKFGYTDQIDKLLNNYNKEEKNKIKIVVAFSVLGLVIFLVTAMVLPFKDTLLNFLYPKPEYLANACITNLSLPEEKAGFVYTGGDLDQAIKNLQTPLYYTYDTTIGVNKQVFVVGGYTYNYTDPLGLRILMDNNLSNIDFKGLWGQVPAGWSVLTAGNGGEAMVDTTTENSLGGGTSVKVTNFKSSSGTQISQPFKKKVSVNQPVIYGVWVKTSDPSSVKILLQNDQEPYQEFGSLTGPIEAGNWTFVTGVGQVPDGVSGFRITFRVVDQNKTAWFNGPTVAVVDLGQPNKTFSNLVLERCGSTWFIDDQPGWKQSNTKLSMKPLTVEFYTLLYAQFYASIKNIDPSATVMPGGIAGAPIAFDGGDLSYSPKLFLDSFRVSYRKFFNNDPPIDALNIHYIASGEANWSGSKDLENYMGKLRSYMDQVPDWKGKPIWIGRLGVDKQAPNGGVDFTEAAIEFLQKNHLNITKWFWFDTCGFNSHLAPLFSSNNKICNWPMELSNVGKIYLTQNIKSANPTVTPIASPSATAVQETPTSSPTSIPTATPTLLPTATSTPIPTQIPTPTLESTTSSQIP